MEIIYQKDSKIITRFKFKQKEYYLSQYRNQYKLLGKSPVYFNNVTEVLNYVKR